MLQYLNKYSVAEIRSCYYCIEKGENLKDFQTKPNAFLVRELPCLFLYTIEPKYIQQAIPPSISKQSR